MGKPNKLTSHTKESKKKVAVNLPKDGGIGVGIVLIGGALATAALVSVLTIGRRLLKSQNNKNGNHGHTTGSNETIQNFIPEDTTTVKDEIKELRPSPSDSSVGIHQNLSNETAKTSVTETNASCMISTKCFFTEEKQNLELCRAEGDLFFDDKEILPASGLHGSDVSRQCDEYVVKPVVGNQMRFQPANMKKDPYGGEIEIIEEESITKIPDAVHSTEEDNQLAPANNEQKVREVKCNEADQSTLIIMQSSEEQESTLIDHDQESNSRGRLPPRSSVSIDADILVPLLYNSSLCKDEKLKINCEEGSQTFETVEILEGAEAVKAVHVDKDHGNSMMLMMEEKEKNCNQLQVWLISESAEQQKRDKKLEAVRADQEKVNGAILMFKEENICSKHGGSLIVQTVEVLKRNEKIDDAGHVDEGNSGLLIVPIAEVLKRNHDNLSADIADGGEISSVMRIGETEKKYDRHDGLTVENAPGLEEDKAIEPAAHCKDKTEILMLEKEIGAPRDDEKDPAGEAAKLAGAIDSVSSSNLQKQLTAKQENPPIDGQEDNFVSDMITFDKGNCDSSAAQNPNLCLQSAQGVSSRFERESVFHSNLKEIQLLVEANEKRDENASGEPAGKESAERLIGSDINPLKQLIGNAFENIEDTPTTEANSVGVIGQMEISQEEDMDDDTDETSNMDQVEENSEGAGDSLAEYNTKPIWPAESLDELSMNLTGLKFDNQVEDSKTLQTGEKLYSNNVEDRCISVESLEIVNECRNNILELSGQNNQQTNSVKPRILDLKWTFMVLLWNFCFWSFGLPYFEISLIAILIILLSKIQCT